MGVVAREVPAEDGAGGREDEAEGDVSEGGVEGAEDGRANPEDEAEEEHACIEIERCTRFDFAAFARLGVVRLRKV